ncbi:MAG TPA: fumarylacetoacetate hydrolase family protein [Candidatus Limnocylindrales bacterium]|nr:fumarylacetoacetate hydrolase family protein [Candidatus Limnocylindrales bacterium]
MRLAHVRERHAPAGTPWRVVAALDDRRWLDLEHARRRAIASRPTLEHDSALHRRPISTLDEALARGLRVAVFGELVDGFAARDEDDDAVLGAGDLAFGKPLLQPLSLRDGYGFEGHVRTVWGRRDADIPENWYRLAVFYFSNVSEMRGPDDPIWAPAGSDELDYELEIAALIDTAARDLNPERAEEAIGGYTIFNDWSARDLQRDETAVRLGPAKGKDFASSIGPYLVTPDELEDARSGRGFDLTMTATVNGAETSRGRWSDIFHGFAELAARASADVRLRPGELLGSGTVGGGCLLEIREQTIGRYLQPGDEVTLTVERLGSLRAPIVARPA